MMAQVIYNEQNKGRSEEMGWYLMLLNNVLLRLRVSLSPIIVGPAKL